MASSNPVIPNNPSPYPYAQHIPTEDEWFVVNHRDAFPNSAVRAMDRSLNNNCLPVQDCYVALWDNNGEPVFGRATNRNGLVEAWFPWGGDEHWSGDLQQPFKILIYRGPPYQNFRYVWIRVTELTPSSQPVCHHPYSPMVVGHIHINDFSGEILGKANLASRKAWITCNCMEYFVTGPIFNDSYVLCREPLHAQHGDGQESQPNVFRNCYAYQPPFPYPNRLPAPVNGDLWIPVSHGSPFPDNAVQAMGRTLTNGDQTTRNCYVAFWTHPWGEPVFGRAWNKNGTVEAWFPWGGEEHWSGDFGGNGFALLGYDGPPKQNFRYAWVPMYRWTSLCKPVFKGQYSPVVMRELDLRPDCSFQGELLGKVNLWREMAWVSYDGREYNFAGTPYNDAFVLCRLPL